MVFSSNIFLLYFLPIFLTVYFLMPSNAKNYVLLFASLLFYAYGAPEFIVQFILSMVINFYLVRYMVKTDKVGVKKLFCGLSITLSLGLLLFYKYGNFTMENVNAILGIANHDPLKWTWIILPIGISFFSFQSITYTLDTYRKVNEPMDKLSDYMLYICMFPQLIAGPIVRYCDVAAQINNRSHSSTEFLNGFYRFVIGLCKKILIADVIASYVDKVLGSSNFSVLSLEQIQSIGESIANLDSTTAWMVMLGYTMQLYFDFAGYSDMAIGLGRMMGFRFPENFDNPYVSTSISEFWRRWHQTLNVFIKNYLYIPLGGSHVKTESRKYFNLWVCFLVSGLWHGASWNFIVWGIIHGTFICLDKLFLWKVQKKTGKIPSMLSTFLIVMMAWMFFRIERIDFAWAFVKRLFAFDFNPISFADNAQVYVTLIVSVFFSFITLTKWGRNLQNLVYFTDFGKKQHLIAWVISIFALIFCVAALNSADFSPFIYFRF